MPKPQLKPIEERDPYAAKVMEAFDNQSAACRICEFEEGWGKPFCGACGNIFDEVPILQRIREYVAGVNDDYKEDEERDQTLAMIDALIRHNGHSAGDPTLRPQRSMKPEHTPGPWEAKRDPAHYDTLSTVVGGEDRPNSNGQPNRRLIVQVGGFADWREQEANARLIAEAGTVLHETGLTPRQLAEQRRELLVALHEGRRAIGDHHAPNDCYATGPVTGIDYRDLVECPACAFIAKYDAAIAKATGKEEA